MKKKTVPTFSIYCDSEENVNLALKQLIQISLEENVIDDVFLKEVYGEGITMEEMWQGKEQIGIFCKS